MVPAEVAQRNLCKPDGSVEPAWVVTAIEEGGVSTVVFSGFEASERATAYARSLYKPVHFRVTAEPGKYFERGSNVGGENGRVQ